jgi:hypothetical protein
LKEISAWTFGLILRGRRRSQRPTFDAQSGTWVKRIDRVALSRDLWHASGFSSPPLYAVRRRQRIGLVQRPRVLHAIVNVWVGRSTQLVVDLHDYLGHRIDMEVITSFLLPQGSHDGMVITLVPQPASPHVVYGTFSRFRPHLVHVHYWGDVDKPWYRVIFAIAAEFGCPVLQNVNTPVAPFCATPIARNIHPGIDLERFKPAAIQDESAFDTIGMESMVAPDLIGHFIFRSGSSHRSPLSQVGS